MTSVRNKTHLLNPISPHCQPHLHNDISLMPMVLKVPQESIHDIKILVPKVQI